MLVAGCPTGARMNLANKVEASAFFFPDTPLSAKWAVRRRKSLKDAVEEAEIGIQELGLTTKLRRLKR